MPTFMQPYVPVAILVVLVWIVCHALLGRVSADPYDEDL